ncbi:MULTISPECIES: type VI secretion system-associated protein TagO [Bradyrhizobium]|uniref:type VI secretion system-associated protein TagO n=1 Tax=Bradyrhizobium elkanii TaxID=29448 RepID=UPI000483F2BB|nr:type VI secretion system-associated protein TagO [Bradyrhizobium elkanii]
MLLRMLLAVFFVVSVSNEQSLAQFEPLAFAMCKKIGADTARLKCFDEIGAELDKKGSQPNTEPAKWAVEEDRSPIDDSPQVSAAIRGEPAGALLVLRCKERKTEAAFLPSDTFITDSGDGVPVLMRLNDEQPLSTMWHKSTSGQAVFVPAPVAFIRLLTDGGKLFIRATGFRGRQSDGLFQLADVSSVRTKIEEACNWSTPKNDRSASKPTANAKSK